MMGSMKTILSFKLEISSTKTAFFNGRVMRSRNITRKERL